MKWVGITGGIGTGKSSVLKIIAQNNLPTLSADTIIHETLLNDINIKNQIISIFGKDILDKKNALDRKKVAKVAFKDKKKMDKLEEIIHPKLAKLVQIKKNKLKNRGEKIAFYEAPLLFEKKMQSQFDATILVLAKKNLAIDRLLAKGFEKNDILNRMKYQLPKEDKLSLATYVIWNNSSTDELEKSCHEIITDITKNK